MESSEKSINIENKEKYGRNTELVVDLIRHPEKEYATGNLTEEGKNAFLDKLKKEYTDPNQKFDTIKAYVSPMKRGQQSVEPLSKFLKESGITTTIRTKEELIGKMNQYSNETDKEMDKILQNRGLLNAEEDLQKDSAFEPISKDEETLKNEILIREFFDKEFPKSLLKGEDFGEDLNLLIQHFAKMSQRFLSDSKVKIIAIGHSGIIEYLTKLIFLKNHPEKNTEDVDVEEIGGLLDYMEGPKITIVSDTKGNQTATLQFKELNLDYEIKE